MHLVLQMCIKIPFSSLLFSVFVFLFLRPLSLLDSLYTPAEVEFPGCELMCQYSAIMLYIFKEQSYSNF